MLLHRGFDGSRSRLRGLALGVVLALALGVAGAGCGDDDAEPEAPPPVEDADPQSEPAPDDADAEEDAAEDAAQDDTSADDDTEPAAADDQPELLWTQALEDNGGGRIGAFAVDPGGEVVYVAHGPTFVLELADGTVVGTIEYSYPRVDDLDVSPDGSLVGAGLGLYGVELTTPEGGVPPGLEDLEQGIDSDGVRFHGGYDNRLAFSPDGRHLATGNRDGEVWIWDLDAADQAASLSVPDPDHLTGLFYHPSGDLLAAVDFGCRLDVWDLDAEEVVHAVELGFSSCYQNAPVAFSPDGALLAAGIREDGVEFTRLWTVEGFEPVLDLDMDVRNFTEVAFSPDSSMLATAAWRMPATVWDVASGDVRSALDSGADPDDDERQPVRVVFTVDGDHVVVGYNDGSVELWRLPVNG